MVDIRSGRHEAGFGKRLEKVDLVRIKLPFTCPQIATHRRTTILKNKLFRATLAGHFALLYAFSQLFAHMLVRVDNDCEVYKYEAYKDHCTIPCKYHIQNHSHIDFEKTREP